MSFLFVFLINNFFEDKLGSHNLKEITDKQLLSLIKEGNQLAFDQMYNRYWKRLFVYTYNILNDEGYAEDTLQEVFIKIWVKKNELDIQNLKSYLFNAVRNNAISKIRKEKLSVAQEGIIDNLVVPSQIEQNLNRDDLKKTIEKAVINLPTRCKAIFYMSRYQNYTIQEIASHFKISHRTVENQLHLALKHIRKVINTAISIISFFSFFK